MLASMPEGPSIVILQGAGHARSWGTRIRRVEGNTTIEKERLLGQRVDAFRSWGKHFLVELPDFTLRVHFMLFGSYRINEAQDAGRCRAWRWASTCGEINFYACSVRFIEEPLDLRVRLVRRRDVASTGTRSSRASACARARHAGLRRAAGPGHLRGRGQHHQERGAVPHPRASAVAPSAPCPRPSCASWCARRATTASSSTSGRSSSC